MSGITTPRDEYTELLDYVQKNRDAVAGERSVKEKNTEYLKPLPSQLGNNGSFTHEGAKSYNNYLSLAMFYGATGITINGFSGLVFRKNPSIELTTNTEYLIDSVRASNQSMISQMQTVVEDAMITPRSGLLTDYPKNNGQMTEAEREAKNIRPVILHYPFESIINWHFATTNNQFKLQFVVLKEVVQEVDEYIVTDVVQYRLLELIEDVYYQSTWSAGGEIKQDREIVYVDGETSNEIPFYIIEPFGSGRSLIDGLVDANFNHYNMFASYANKEFTSGFPIFYETGVQGGDCEDVNVSIGPGAKWTSQNPDAQFGVLETSSDGGSLRTYLEDRKSEMATLGADALSPRTMQAESGESKKLDKIGQNATVADVANTVSDAYEQAVKFAAKWVGDNPDDVSIKLNTDYIPTEMNPQLLTGLMAALQSGSISYDTFWANLQKGELADPEITAEEERAKINIDMGGLDQ